MAAPVRLAARHVLCKSSNFISQNSSLLFKACASKTSTKIFTALPATCTTLCRRHLHFSAPANSLKEFFDHKDTFGQNRVRTGAPWRKDELRLKSNSDLHKLWYVLLKERNMLMTMEDFYKGESLTFPNPERHEKVEESMENLLEVVRERDRAVHMLEEGKTGEPVRYPTKNILGLPIMRTSTEHLVPEFMNKTFVHKKQMAGRWQEPYLRQYAEKQLRIQRWESYQKKKHFQKLREVFPDADYENWDTTGENDFDETVKYKTLLDEETG